MTNYQHHLDYHQLQFILLLFAVVVVDVVIIFRVNRLEIQLKINTKIEMYQGHQFSTQKNYNLIWESITYGL